MDRIGIEGLNLGWLAVEGSLPRACSGARAVMGDFNVDLQGNSKPAGMINAVLERVGLAAVNVTWKAGSTYFGQDHSSRLDYVCVPKEEMTTVQGCCVLQKKGALLQMVNIPRPHDHWPFQVTIAAQAAQPVMRQERLQWDRRALAAEIQTGMNRDIIVAL